MDCMLETRCLFNQKVIICPVHKPISIRVLYAYKTYLHIYCSHTFCVLTIREEQNYKTLSQIDQNLKYGIDLNEIKSFEWSKRVTSLSVPTMQNINYVY